MKNPINRMKKKKAAAQEKLLQYIHISGKKKKSIWNMGKRCKETFHQRRDTRCKY